LETDEKTWLSLKEAALHIGMSAAFLRRSVRERRVPFARPGGKILKFSRAALDQWLEDSGVGRDVNGLNPERP